MVTQKDIHNILVKSDDTYKANIIKQCDYDVEKIKKLENTLANIANITTETVGKAWAYMNEELKK